MCLVEQTGVYAPGNPITTTFKKVGKMSLVVVVVLSVFQSLIGVVGLTFKSLISFMYERRIFLESVTEFCIDVDFDWLNLKKS